MSSSSKSSSSTATKTSTTDARVAADNGAIVTKSGDVNVLDGGAINLAKSTAQNAFDAAQGLDFALPKVKLPVETLAELVPSAPAWLGPAEADNDNGTAIYLLTA